MTDHETCDYCYDDLPRTFHLRAVGFMDDLGFRAPQVRTWCGICEPDDTIDPAAETALRLALQRQMEAKR